MDNKVGPYQLGDSLGAMPFGELVAATHTARRESLAFLILDERLSKDQRFRGLLRLEVARAGGVRHPALARPLEVGEQAGSLYVVIERPGDATVLPTIIDDARTPERVAALVQALAAGLDAAHDRRLAHGALGPSSVLVRSDGSPLLVGVGLLGAVEEAGLGAVVSEAAEDAYTAPEQRSGPRAVTSADGFALAALADSLLPSPSADARAVLDRQRAASPSDRFPTCTAFAAALTETLVSSTTTATAVSEAAAPPPSNVPAEGVNLPWEETARVDLAADVQEVVHEPLPWTPPSPGSVRSVAEPVPESPAPADTPPLPWTVPPSIAVEDRIVTIPATPAVLACLGRLESKDPLGDGVHWVADRVPVIAQLLDRVCVNGKVGPVPLGIAAAGLVALLLLVTNQLVPAMAVVGLVGVLYGIPLVTGKLSGEAARQEIVRVTGTARLSGRTDSMLGGLPRLGLTNHLLLSLTPHAFDSLARYAVPVRVDRPIPGAMGVRPEIVAYDLPGVTVSYVAGNRLLLDVRAPTGVVLYRYPLYEGEPGDPPLAPDDGLPPAPAVTSTAADLSFSPPYAFQPDTADRLSGTASQASHASRHQMTPRLSNALATARKDALQQAALFATLPVALAIFFAITGLGFFVFFTLIAGVVLIFMGPGGRVVSLWNIRDANVVAQATGPISLMRSKQGKSYKYQLRLFDGTDMEITSAAYERLRREGQRVGGDGGDFSFERMFSMNPVLDEYTLPSVTTSYLPSNLLLLEVINPFDTVYYRDSALADGDVPHLPRTI